LQVGAQVVGIEIGGRVPFVPRPRWQSCSGFDDTIDVHASPPRRSIVGPGVGFVAGLAPRRFELIAIVALAAVALAPSVSVEPDRFHTPSLKSGTPAQRKIFRLLGRKTRRSDAFALKLYWF